MASDDLIWLILDKGFCAHRTNAVNEQNICKHPMNVDGYCCKTYCPLANSKYATVVERRGKIFLCIKTPERMHLPSKLWEKIELPEDYKKAMEEIDYHLQYWSEGQINRVKKRFTKLRLVLRRIRKLRSKVRHKIVAVNKKEESKLKAREKRAEEVAKIEHQIERELLERLRNGVYGELYKKKLERKQKEEEEEKEDVYEVEAATEEEEDTLFPHELNTFEEESIEDIEEIYREMEQEEEEDDNTSVVSYDSSASIGDATEDLLKDLEEAERRNEKKRNRQKGGDKKDKRAKRQIEEEHEYATAKELDF